MVHTIINKRHRRISDLKFMRMVEKYDTIPILMYYQNGKYTIAILMDRKCYFIESTTIDGIKTILRYFRLKPGKKLKRNSFLIT